MDTYKTVIILYSYLTIVNGNCDTVLEIPNASHNITTPGPYAPGTVVKFSCNEGYRPYGYMIYECLDNSWGKGDLECEQIFCGYVVIPDNGVLLNSPTYEVGSYMTFGCREGFTVVGTSRLFCRIDGEWNPPDAPRCEIKNCGEFGDIQHGSVFQVQSNTERNAYGSVVEVTCDRGYIVVGSPRVECDKDGKWGDKPTCEPITCDPYPGLKSSCVSQTKLTTTGMLFMQCKSDVSVTKTGPSVVRCNADGWDPDPSIEVMACFCDCKVDFDASVISVTNLTDDGYLKHEDTLQWSCKNGGKKSNNNPLRCNDGKMEEPVCVAAHTSTPWNEKMLIISLVVGVVVATAVVAVVGVVVWYKHHNRVCRGRCMD